MAQVLTVGGVPIRKPTKFSIEKYNLTKSGRTANGLMTMDIIAKKRKFLFEYEVISGADMEVITAVIDGASPFFTLTYLENDTAKSATVYAGSIVAEQFRTTSGWYWKNFKFDLIEQ